MEAPQSPQSKFNATQFTVQGMTCAGCAARVEKAIRALPGIASVAVNLGSGQASVEHDPVTTPPARIQQAILAAGYKIANAA
jgi:P-type Cu+ transporter